MGVKVEAFPSENQRKKRFRLGYIQELKSEFRKITWTSKDELILSTKLVVGSIFAFGLGTYIADLTIKGLLNSVAAFVHFIFG